MNKAEQKYIDYCKNNYGLSVSEPTDDMLFKYLDKKLDTFLKDGYILLPNNGCMPLSSIYQISFTNIGYIRTFQITFVDGSTGLYSDVTCNAEEVEKYIKHIADRIWGKSQIKTEFI